jgi:hypothetical protein
LCAHKERDLGYLTQTLDITHPGDGPKLPTDLIVCPRTMQLPLFKEIKCDMLSDYVHSTLDTIAATWVHEYIHWAALCNRR